MTRCIWVTTVLFFLMVAFGPAWAMDAVEVLGVKLPREKIVAGKTLRLNGTAFRKAMGIVKVYVVGLYLETPTDNAETVIHAEQVKQLYFHYLTDKATAKNLREGYLELIRAANPPDMVERNQADIDRYAGWYDKDMQPGLTAVNTYVPGEGMTLVYQGETKGTITNPEFIRMYYQYNFGAKADARIRDGLLGK